VIRLRDPRRAAAGARPLLRAPLRALAFLASLALAVPASAQSGLQFDGTNDHVTFGTASQLGATTFTIECWFKRTGVGATASTGTGGVTAVPLLAKGRGEADGSTLDMNWFLGIRGTDSVLVADYEEGTGQTSPGLNHPVAGTTVIRSHLWYHAAATFDGTTLRLYLNGMLEATLVVGAGRLPQAASVQHASLATALSSTGAAAGFFAGALDEPRVWSVARSQAEIQAGLAGEIASGPGLLGRWGLNEGAGTTASNSVAGSPAGALVNDPAWVAGSPFSVNYALLFNGTNGVASFGNPPELGLPQFTIECWFRRDGAGTGTNTGTGGAIAIPLLAHGRGDQDTGQVHVNWFLGIRASDHVLMADFEESSAGPSPSLNHPVFGTTPIPADGVWHHGAATYDGATWRLYLDGILEATLDVHRPAGTPTVMPASLGSALNTAGTADGFFHGAIDEARVWSVARDSGALVGAINTPLEGPVAGLVARWGLNEGAGTTISSSAGTPLPGALSGTGWAWTGGAPFDLPLTPPVPPAAPTGASATALTSTSVRVQWTDASNNETQFQIERSTTGAGGPFALRGTVGANVTTFDDTGLTPLAEFCYRVRASNAAGASDASNVACATTPEVTRTALDLAGSTYVGFGDPAALDLATFTIECWFRRDGAGSSTSTGTGGVGDAIPLVTKGRGESEASNVDLNWFLGLRASDGVLVADFEEGAGGASPSLNHPVIGVTPLPPGGGWHHAAATYDGTTWNLYLDGNLEATLVVGQPCASASTQQAAIGSALTSTGAAAGFFDGAFDEVRVWNVARTLAEIRGTANAELDAATPGLVARWALDEGAGTAVAGSAGTAVNGTISGANYAWVPPAPFDLAFNDPPALPALVGPADGATGVATNPTLAVAVSDADGDSVTVRFYGRAVSGAPGADFTLIGLPDTQYYTAQLNGGSNAMLKAQTSWIAAQRASRNIAYAVQLGDCVESGDNGGDPIQWLRADTAYALIEDPISTGLPDGVPYGICVGNHDQSPNGDANGTTTFYNQYFGEARFLGRAYYGGHHGTNNDNWFDLFSAGGLDFICIGLEYDTTPDAAVLDWADSLMKAHPNRRAIVASHNLLGTGNPGAFSTQGAATYNALRDNPNFFLMLCGHVPGEGRRSDVFEGRTVHTLMSDYQSRSGGGSGWLRIMEFSPANNVIRVRTYSPWLDQWEADADSSSQFTLAYDMSGAGASFALLGTVRVASGETASLPWSGLDPNTPHEWYVTVSDGSVTRTGPTWDFTTGAAPVAVDDRGAAAFALEPVVPNPAHGATRVRFAVPVETPVRVSVLDVMGREVAVIAEGAFRPGRHDLAWDGASRSGPLPSGIYFVRMRAPGFSAVRRVALVH